MIQRYQNSSLVEVLNTCRSLLLVCEAANGQLAAEIGVSDFNIQIFSFFSVPCESPVIQGYQNGSMVGVPPAYLRGSQWPTGSRDRGGLILTFKSFLFFQCLVSLL